MKKTKTITLLSAALVSVGLVGATLAYFTSNDSLDNIFNLGGGGDPNDPNTGIIAIENFGDSDLTNGVDVNGDDDIIQYSKAGVMTDFEKENYTANESQELVYLKNNDATSTEEKPGDPVLIMPGDVINKDMAVHSTVNYDQYVRAKIVVLVNGTEYTGDNIEVNLTGNWIESDGYHYYPEVLKPYSQSEDIVDSVTFKIGSDNDYKDLNVQVKLEAEAYQTQNFNSFITDIDPDWTYKYK